MNHKERILNRKSPRSRISRLLLLQCFLALVGFAAATAILILLAWRFVLLFTWDSTNPLYWILQAIRDHSIFFVGLFLLGGWAAITYYFISKPLRYLDEVIGAAEQMAVAPEEPVILSPAMVDTQSGLNSVREKALSDAHAAKEAEQRKNDLIVYLAHDLKTPLTSVIGYLSLLQAEPQIPQELRAKYTGIALDKAERLEDLINEFFEITRFNLTKLELNRETVSLSRMLEQILFEFKPVLAAKELTWDAKLTPDVHIICDPDKMERVFDNLFRNAVDYSYRKTQISVTLKQEEGCAAVKIENRGKTIPQEKLARVFEQFFRLDSSRGTATGGAGLGLAIAKEIVEFHGGTIAAESADESIGLTVTLPL